MGLGDNMTALFNQREERFLASLEKVLAVIGRDVYIQQMFEDDNSASYIPDRLCELVQTVLTDDREAFLQRIMTRVNALEACFGSERIKRLEEIGTRFIEFSLAENRDNVQIRKCVELLRRQLSALDTELAVKYGGGSETIGYLEAQVREARECAVDVSAQVRNLNQTIQETLANTKATLMDFLCGGIPIENLREQCEKRIGLLKGKLRKAVGVIKEQVDEAEALKKEVERLKKQESVVELEALRQELREVKADCEIKEIALERVNSQNQVLVQESEEKDTKLREMRVIVADLTDKIAALENVTGDRTRELRSEKQKTDTLKDVVAEHRQEIKALKQGLREYDRQFRKYQASLEEPSEGSGKIAELSEENMKMQRTLSYYESTIETMKQKEAERDEATQRQDDRISDLQAELEHCKSTLAKQKKNFDAQMMEKEEELRTLKKQKAQVEDDLEEMEMQLQKLQRVTQSQLSDKEEEISRMQEEIEEYRSASQDAYDDLMLQKSAMESENQGVVSKLFKKIQKLQKVSEEQLQTIEDLEQANAELQETSHSLMKEESEREAALLDEIDKLSEENNHLRGAVETLHSQVTTLSQQQKTTTQKLESDLEKEMKQKIVALEDTVRSLQRQNNDEAQRNAKKLNRKIGSLSELNEKLTQQARQDQNRIDKLEAEIAQKDIQIREMNRDVVQLRQKLFGGSAPISDPIPWLRGKNQALEQKSQDTQMELSLCEAKLETQTRSLNELSRENKRLERELERTKLELKHIQYTSTLNETQQSKKIQSICESSQKLTELCGVQTLEQVCDVVTEMMDSVSNGNSAIQKMKQITGNDDPVSAARQHKKDSDELKRLQKALLPNAPLTPVDNLINDIAEQNREKSEMCTREKALLRALRIESPHNILKAVNNIQSKCDKQEEIILAITRILKIDSNEDIIDKSEQLVKEHRELKTKLCTIMGVETIESALEQASSMKQTLSHHQTIHSKLSQMLDTTDEDEIPDLISQLLNENDELADREEQIMVTLSVENPDDILKRLDEQHFEISRYAKILETLLTTLNCHKDIEIIDKVTQLLDEAKAKQTETSHISQALGIDNPLQTEQRIKYLSDCAEILQDLCHLLNVSQPDTLPSAVASLIDSNKRIQSLHALFPPDLSNSTLKDKISQLMERNTELTSELDNLAMILNSKDLEKAVTQIQTNLETASSFLSRVFSVFSTTPVTLTLPLSRATETRLMDTVCDFKARTERVQTQVNSILARAKADGFRGNSVVDAVDFIAANCAVSERQKTREEMRRDLMEVRATSEMERNFADRQREKNRRRIGELRSGLALSASREEELRQKVKEMGAELEQERKLRKSSEL